MARGLKTIRKWASLAAAKARSDTYVSLVVVCDADSSQCLYIDGERWRFPYATTVYASDLVEAAAGRLIDLRQQNIDFVHDEWPERLEDAVKHG